MNLQSVAKGRRSLHFFTLRAPMPLALLAGLLFAGQIGAQDTDPVAGEITSGTVTKAETSRASAAKSLPRESIVVASLVVKVRAVDEATDRVIGQASDQGGYFTERNNTSVTVRIPSLQVADFLAYCEALGQVIDRQYETRDISQQLNEQRSRLGARQEVLKKYFAVLAESSAQGVLSVEQEITRLVAEIEQLKGSNRLLEHQARLAQVTVRFEFRDRTAPARDGRSSFPWLNTMNLADLVEDFRYEH